MFKNVFWEKTLQGVLTGYGSELPPLTNPLQVKRGDFSTLANIKSSHHILTFSFLATNSRSQHEFFSWNFGVLPLPFLI